MRHALFVAAITLAALVATPGASAQSPDRDSSAGQEYRIPVDYTRCEYSSGGCKKAEGARDRGPTGSRDPGAGTGDGGPTGPRDPGAGPGDGAQEVPPLFGAGIKPERAGFPDRRGSERDLGGRERRGGVSDELTARDQSQQGLGENRPLEDGRSTVGDPVHRTGATVETKSELLPTGGLALGVLAVGGLLGLGLRRLGRNRTA